MSSIRLPITERLSALLGSSRENSAPSARITYQELGQMLQKRVENPEFWAPLTELLKELIDGAVNGKSAAWQRIPQLKMLATWDVEELSKRLREALPQLPAIDPDNGVTLCERSASAREAKVAVLSAFLLLGLAAGCSNSSSPAGGTHDGGVGTTGGSSSIQPGGTGGTFSCPYPASDAGKVAITNSDAGTPSACSAESVSALWDIIDGACLNNAEKQAILGEFADLKASWCNGLVELFKTESPAQIAAQLESLMRCGGLLGNSEFTTEVRQQLVAGMSCVVTLYKGVSFPEDEQSRSIATEASAGQRDG